MFRLIPVILLAALLLTGCAGTLTLNDINPEYKTFRDDMNTALDSFKERPVREFLEANPFHVGMSSIPDGQGGQVYTAVVEAPMPAYLVKIHDIGLIDERTGLNHWKTFRYATHHIRIFTDSDGIYQTFQMKVLFNDVVKGYVRRLDIRWDKLDRW